MRLRGLEIQGFKSFPDKTRLTFHDGITAVVGPNGSGKSNIADAVRWVLGEQSTKTLRGGKMEDVIFGGTQARKPQGYAHVQLTIENADGALPYDSAEVSVSRPYGRRKRIPSTARACVFGTRNCADKAARHIDHRTGPHCGDCERQKHTAP
ncbi:MAG: AAA family ATPase [Anaerotruncus colihominis]